MDTHRPANEFDVIAFNLSSELVYTNLINCLDLAGVPVMSSERNVKHPVIGAGGHCVYNPEPLADIVDFFALGDGEEVVSDITEVMHQFKSITNGSQSRQKLLFELSKIEGVYVPSMYEAIYDMNGAQVLKPINNEVPKLIEKRTIVDLEEWPYPKAGSYTHLTLPTTPYV